MPDTSALLLCSLSVLVCCDSVGYLPLINVHVLILKCIHIFFLYSDLLTRWGTLVR